MNFTFIIYVSHFIIVKSVIFGHFAIEFRRKSHENRHITIEHNQKGTMSITPFVSRYAQRTHTPRRGNNKQVACMLHVSARLCVRVRASELATILHAMCMRRRETCGCALSLSQRPHARSSFVHMGKCSTTGRVSVRSVISFTLRCGRVRGEC